MPARNPHLHHDPASRLTLHRDQILPELIGLIRASHLTFNQLAEQSGTTPLTISRWCCGETRWPRVDTVRRVLLVLGYQLAIIPLDHDQDARH